MTHNTQSEEAEIQFDLNAPNEFAAALKKKIGRRFTFGPITFTDLDQPIDAEATRQLVQDMLNGTESMQKAGEILVHGLRIKVKDRTLKRGTSLLKHSRFLSNLEACPVFPAEPEPQPENNEGQEEDAE